MCARERNMLNTYTIIELSLKFICTYHIRIFFPQTACNAITISHISKTLPSSYITYDLFLHIHINIIHTYTIHLHKNKFISFTTHPVPGTNILSSAQSIQKSINIQRSIIHSFSVYIQGIIEEMSEFSVYMCCVLKYMYMGSGCNGAIFTYRTRLHLLSYIYVCH